MAEGKGFGGLPLQADHEGRFFQRLWFMVCK